MSLRRRIPPGILVEALRSATARAPQHGPAMTLYAFRSRWEPAPRVLPGAMLLGIGDVHGHAEHLDALLYLIRPEITRARRSGLDSTLVLLGDYVDRGPDSIGSLRQLVGLSARIGTRVHILCGNHDQHLLGLVLAERPDPLALEAWCGNGGLTTLAELGIRRPEVGNRDPAELAARARVRLGPDLLKLLRRLEVARSVGGYLCVHGGIHPTRPVWECERSQLLSLREPFLSGKGWRHGFTAIHGHTIRGPEVLPHRIAVDSGVYRTGVLSAVQIEGDRLRFLCVTDDPKLKSFARLPGLQQRRRFSAPERAPAEQPLAVAVGA